MKKHSLRFAAGAVFVLSLAAGARADVFVDFNTADVLTNEFTASPTPMPGNMAVETDGIGLGGSRALSIVGAAPLDTAATYNLSGLDFSATGASITVSMFMKTVDVLGTTGEDRILELNLVANSTNVPIGAHDGVGGKIEFVPNADTFDSIGIEFRRNNADAAGSQTPDANAFDIQPTTWYKVSFKATNNGAGQPIPASVVIDDYGATGAALVTANVISNSFNIATSLIAPDADVFAAFRVRNGTRLISVLDNFEAKLTTPPTGNANFDGLNGVNGEDFLTWQKGLATTGGALATGDANNDMMVNDADLTIWKGTYGPSVAVSAPEPAAASLLVVGAACVAFARRRRR